MADVWFTDSFGRTVAHAVLRPEELRRINLRPGDRVSTECVDLSHVARELYLGARHEDVARISYFLQLARAHPRLEVDGGV